ncbi:MAG: glycosyltransferase family 39 protein [Pseudomonadota bacterium]|nr:glycosyltransferase family 39 protein [Pseudomonadota bacterium]
MRIWILFLGFIGLVALSLIAVPVHFDEAQYTTWLTYQDLSYQTKGPLVTAVQSVTHGFEFLPQLVQVRLPAWIAWLLSGFLLLWLGRLAGFDQDASRRLLILYVTSPMLFVLGMVHTTDIWLLFFMLLALCAFASILHCRPNQQTELWWLLMGAALGFGALAKLSIALVPLSLFVWVILRTPRLIVTPGPYIGALLCGFVMTPWILWNMDRDFAHLSHEFGHVNSANDHWFHTVDWIPLLLLATLPVILLSLFGGLRMRLDDLANEREEAVRDMLRFSFGVLILLFVLKGIFGKVVLNWTVPMVPVLLMIFAMRMRWSPASTLIAGCIQIAILVVLIYPYAVGLSIKQDPFQKIRGWDRVVQDAARLSGPTDVVTTDHYSMQAWALYFWPSDRNGIDRYATPEGQVIPTATRRRNQYDNWDVLSRPTQSLVHIGQYSEDLAERCASFDELGPVPQVMPDGTIRSILTVYRCQNFNPEPAWPVIKRH